MGCATSTDGIGAVADSDIDVVFDASHAAAHPAHWAGEHARARAAADPGADRFRAPDIRYLTQIAHAAEHMGFDAILTPTGTWCEDAWLTCAALAPETERLRFTVHRQPIAAQVAPVLSRVIVMVGSRSRGPACQVRVNSPSSLPRCALAGPCAAMPISSASAEARVVR